jgi:hypothetical protein
MKKLFLIGIPALLLATGAAYAADTTETWDQGRLCSINIFLCKEETCPNATVSFQPGTAQIDLLPLNALDFR